MRMPARGRSPPCASRVPAAADPSKSGGAPRSEMGSRRSCPAVTASISAASATVSDKGPLSRKRSESPASRPRRHPPVARLDPIDTAVRGRLGDGAGGVRAGRPGHQAGGDRSRRAAAGSAGTAARVEGVDRVRSETVLALAEHTERGGVGLAHDDRTGGAQSFHHDAVRLRNVLGVGGEAESGPYPCRLVQVLDRHRDSQQRPVAIAGLQRGVGPGGVFERTLRAHGQKGIERPDCASRCDPGRSGSPPPRRSPLTRMAAAVSVALVMLVPVMGPVSPLQMLEPESLPESRGRRAFPASIALKPVRGKARRAPASGRRAVWRCLRTPSWSSSWHWSKSSVSPSTFSFESLQNLPYQASREHQSQ